MSSMADLSKTQRFIFGAALAPFVVLAFIAVGAVALMICAGVIEALNHSGAPEPVLASAIFLAAIMLAGGLIAACLG